MGSSSPPTGVTGTSSRSPLGILVDVVVAVVGSVGYVLCTYLVAILLGIPLVFVVGLVFLLFGGTEAAVTQSSVLVATMATETILLGVGASLLAVASVGTDVVPRDQLGLAVPTSRQLLTAIVAAVALVGAAYGFEQLAASAGVAPSEHALMDEEPSAVTYFGLIPVAILLVGPVEELLFRGLVQNFVRPRLGAAAGIVWTSLLFATVHLPAYFLAGFEGVVVSLTVVFVLSVGLGWFYERLGNLPAVALVHGLYDAILFALAGFVAL